MRAELIDMSDRKLCVGVVTAAHGVSGQVRVKSFTATAGDIARYKPLTDASGERVFCLDIVGRAKGVLLARIDGILNRDAADELRGTKLFVERNALPDADDEDEFYHVDLVGLAAILPDGNAYGTVKAVYDFGAGDMIEFELTESGDVILPFTRAVIPEIDLDQGWIIVDPPNMFGDPELGLPSKGGDEEVDR